MQTNLDTKSKEGVPDYDNYEHCSKLLKNGIVVIKHNYTNFEHKRVKIFLAKDGSNLYYDQIDPSSKLKAFLRGSRNISFSNIVGVVYGPFSSTFEKRKPMVLDAMNFEQSMYQTFTQDEHDHHKMFDTEKESLEDDKLSGGADSEKLSVYHQKLFMDQDEYDNQQKRAAKSQRHLQFMVSDKMFYAWECISIVLKNRTTIDLVIKDSYQLMCLLHVLHHNIYAKNKKQLKEEHGCLRGYKFLKIKMKLSY